MNIAYTSSDILQRMAHDHPGTEIEYHDGVMFLTLRGVTWHAIAEDVA